MIRRRSPADRVTQVTRIITIGVVLALSVSAFFFAGTDGGFPAHAVASLQLFPSIARIAGLTIETAGILAVAGVVGMLAGSAVFGRWYCSVLCPLGALQGLTSLVNGKRRRYRKPIHSLRAVILVGVVWFATAGAMSIAALLDPWSIFGRFMTHTVQPAVHHALRADMPGLRVEIVVASALAMAAVLGASAFSGRWFCGNLCPVGTVLGALNRFAPLRLRLDTDTCISCGRCSAVCGASCVDDREKLLDSTRCIYCLACVPACPTGAIRYGRATRVVLPAVNTGLPVSGPKPVSRAQFIVALGGGTVVLASAAMSGKGVMARSLARAEGGESIRPVTPPGSISVGRFVKTCTACGLCVARCPAGILRPAVGQFGAAGLLVPRLDYSVSYCQFDCTACLDVCPSGALAHLSPAQKRRTKIGDATLIKERCIVITNGTRCGACAEHCPTGAVRMVTGETGLPEPVFTREICIGCGACHHACPVEPDKAISVFGLAEHTLAEIPAIDLFDAPSASPGKEGETVSPEKTDEFPF